jgi:hypothetical protein
MSFIFMKNMYESFSDFIEHYEYSPVLPGHEDVSGNS